MTTRRPISARMRFEVLKRDGFCCQYCGARGPDTILHVDHIDPVARGGTNDISNLIAACRDCNLGKGAVEIVPSRNGARGSIIKSFLLDLSDFQSTEFHSVLGAVFDLTRWAQVSRQHDLMITAAVRVFGADPVVKALNDEIKPGMSLAEISAVFDRLVYLSEEALNRMVAEDTAAIEARS